MWQAITDFILKASPTGIGHDAVIEIMIALLGLMIAVLTLISALFAAAVAVIGFFGFQTIREEASRRAAETASQVAKSTAEVIAAGVMNQVGKQEQASGLSESQNETVVAIDTLAEAVVDKIPAKKQRRRATSDTNLKRGNE